MKIGLFGQFGSGNTGNDGSLEAMLHVLNRISPNAQLVCICSDPEIITPKFQIRAVLWDKPLPRISICACSTGCFSTSPQADWLHWCLDAGRGSI